MNKRFTAFLAAGLATAFAAQPAAARTVYGDCSITVGGKVYLNIKKTCRIDLESDGSFQINLNAKKPSYFAYVSILDGGFANVSWNGVEKASHADTLLGEDFRRSGGCWIGRKGKVCAIKR
ncbi:hypothetical protein [Sphingomonas sp.]|uniref:hypothetical protein n=1 Tax=Sphingomonas sp. TaxID=28214 RepID=UPI001EB2E80B|nr:hypothetical protein [Sphingomonas sp.]MBX3594879.1 hypothetical protein [Sphingomonas sp.]